MANLIGQALLKQFRVDAFIASGGMGSVYRVWDLKRNVPLAMKVLHGELAEDPSVFKQFQREANALKKLAHPHIVPFYGLYNTLDFAFLLERFIDGPSLKDIIKKKSNPMQIKEALIYIKALSSALGYAHTNGVVHCDIKPGNVMLDQGGNIYLTDFGVARHADSAKTTIGSAGTPAYMPPEQIMGDAVTPATDIYSLGTMLFEMLTGKRPFRGQEIGTEKSGATLHEKIRYAQLHTPAPDPRTLNPLIPADLAEVILKSLSKSPNDRYFSTTEFFAAVCKSANVNPDDIPNRTLGVDLSDGSFQAKKQEPLTQSQQISHGYLLDSKRSPKPWTWVGLGASVVVLFLVFGLCTIILFSGFLPSSQVIASEEVETPTKLVEIASTKSASTVEVVQEEGSISVSEITEDNVGKIQELYKWESGNEAISLSISPDGTLIASGDKSGEVKVWQAWTDKVVYKIPGMYTAFSPDGKLLGTAGPSGVYLYDTADGSYIRALNEVQSYHSIVFSSNGKLVAAGGSYGKFFVWSVSDGSLVESGSNLGGDVNSVSFSNNSELLGLSSIDKTYVWDLREDKIARSITLNNKQKFQYLSTVLDGSGELFAAGSEYGNIVLWRVSNGETIMTIPACKYPVFSLQFVRTDDSADLLVSRCANKIAFWEIQGYTYTGSSMEFPNPLLAVVVAPNNKYIAVGDDSGFIHLMGVKP